MKFRERKFFENCNENNFLRLLSKQLTAKKKKLELHRSIITTLSN